MTPLKFSTKVETWLKEQIRLQRKADGNRAKPKLHDGQSRTPVPTGELVLREKRNEYNETKPKQAGG